MCGSSRRQRVDRASLDAVSIHQLQHAVAQFAAVGEGHMVPGPAEARCVAAISLLSPRVVTDHIA